MSFWAALVWITAIAAFTILKLNGKIGTRHSRHETLPDPRSREFETEVTRLRERIAVLERIVTEERGTRNIAREIEALRD